MFLCPTVPVASDIFGVLVGVSQYDAAIVAFTEASHAAGKRLFHEKDCSRLPQNVTSGHTSSIGTDRNGSQSRGAAPRKTWTLSIRTDAPDDFSRRRDRRRVRLEGDQAPTA